MKYPQEKNSKPTKYPQKDILDLQNILKKTIWNYEISKIKNFKSTKYTREKVADQQNTLKKILQP